MAVTRLENSYFVTTSANDGFVIHDTSALHDGSASLLVGWDYYDDYGDCDSYIAFDSIAIPKEANIINAILRVNLFRSYNGYVETELKVSTGNDIPTNYSEFTSLVGGAEYYPIHIDVQSLEQAYIYNVTSLIVEKIENQDWEINNNIIFFTENTTKETADSCLDFDSYDFDIVSELTIIYETSDEITLNDILKGNRYEYYKYEKLSLSSGEYVHNGFIENEVKPGGNISINFDRNIIGTINLTINDNATINYLSDLIRPWYYTEYEGLTYKFPLGTFLLLSPNRHSDGKSIERPVHGFDLLYALEQDKINNSVSYDAGDNVIDTVKAILDSVGSWVTYNIPDSSETLAEDISYELGKSKLFVINSLLHKINYYSIWCSGLGVFRSIPWSEIPNKIWTFEDNNESLYAKGTLQKIDYANIFNKVIIIARQLTQDTEPLYKELTFEDIDMDDFELSYTSIGRYITKVFQSEATSQSYVDLRAERELRKMTEIEESINYRHALIFGRFGDGLPYNGDSFKFINDLLGVEYEYKIESMKIILKTGKLVNTNIRRVIDA